MVLYSVCECAGGQTRLVHLIPGQCWLTYYQAQPTLAQYWVNVLVHEPDPENLAFTTTWGGKFPLYFSESYISWDVISA